MRSALYIGSKQNNPLTRTQIPSCASPNGMPFCFEYSGAVTQWQLVKDGEEYGYDLDVSWLTNDGKYIYYNGDVDLLEYLTGLGYNVGAGRWYYAFRLDGYSTGEDRLDVITGNNAFAYIPSAKVYGEWIIDIDYTLGQEFSCYIISNDTTTPESDPLSNPYVKFSITSGYGFFKVDVGYTFSQVTFDTIVHFPYTGRYSLRIVRNSYDNEFFNGVAGLGRVYVNSVQVAPYSDDLDIPLGITSTYINYGGVKTVPTSGLYYFDGYLPSDFITSSGDFGITIQNEGTAGGTIQQSNVFRMECEDLRPVTPGDFNNDLNNDFF